MAKKTDKKKELDDWGSPIKPKRPGGWLCAVALLGLPRTLELMKRERLTLLDAEIGLRHMTGSPSFRYLREDEWPGDLHWADLPEAGPWEPWGVLMPVSDGEQVDWYSADHEVLEYAIDSWDRKRRKKHKEKWHRDISSWMLDEPGEKLGKVRIALGISKRDDRHKRRKQLQENSAAVLKAIRLIEGKWPSEVRKWRPQGRQGKLLREASLLSLEAAKFRDTLKTLEAEKLRWEEKEWEAKQQLALSKKAIEEELAKWRRLSGTEKTGKKNPPK